MKAWRKKKKLTVGQLYFSPIPVQFTESKQVLSFMLFKLIEGVYLCNNRLMNHTKSL